MIGIDTSYFISLVYRVDNELQKNNKPEAEHIGVELGEELLRDIKASAYNPSMRKP